MPERFTPDQNSNQMLRRPPSAGGPRRVPEEPMQAAAPRRGWFRRNLKYLLPLISTGGGTGALTYFLLS